MSLRAEMWALRLTLLLVILGDWWSSCRQQQVWDAQVRHDVVVSEAVLMQAARLDSLEAGDGHERSAER